MRNDIPVADIMTQNVISVNLNDSLREAKRTLKKNKIRHIPVLHENELVGILSQTDILRLSFGSKFGEGQMDADEAVFDMLTIESVMKHKPKTVYLNDTIQDVAEIFASEEYHALPVIDSNDKLIGIVTTTDVIRYLLDYQPA